MPLAQTAQLMSGFASSRIDGPARGSRLRSQQPARSSILSFHGSEQDSQTSWFAVRRQLPEVPTINRYVGDGTRRSPHSSPQGQGDLQR